MQIIDNLKMFCLKNGISMSELARRMSKSPQAFSQKINRGSISLDDLENIAVVTGCKLECTLTMPTGEKMQINL